MNNLKNVCIVAAHPDDEILGMGGTLAAITDRKIPVSVLFLSSGVGSRAEELQTPEARLLDAVNSLRILGVTDLTFLDFPDNAFDTVPLLEVTKKVESFFRRKNPQSVFTNYIEDLNVDHRITSQAVLTACRPTPNSSIVDLYQFQTLSSSEWNFGAKTFNPNLFVNIENYIELKIKALGEYRAELNVFPHPRSIEAVEAQAKLLGSQSGFRFAEGFIQIFARRLIC